MNADARQPHYDSHQDSHDDQHIDGQLEARLVALVLGDASDFEREELARLLEERPELIAFVDEMRSVHGLLQSAGSGELAAPDDEWKLAPKRRDYLFAVFSGEVAAGEANAPGQHVVSQAASMQHGWWPRRWLAGVTAAAAVVLLAVYLGTGPRQAQLASQAELADRRSEAGDKKGFDVVIVPQSSEGEDPSPKPEVWSELARNRHRYRDVDLSGPRRESAVVTTDSAARGNKRLKRSQLFVGPTPESFTITEHGVLVPGQRITRPLSAKPNAAPIATGEYVPAKPPGDSYQRRSLSLFKNEAGRSGGDDHEELSRKSDEPSKPNQDEPPDRSQMAGSGGGGFDDNGPQIRLGPPTSQPTAEPKPGITVMNGQSPLPDRPTTESGSDREGAPGPELKDRLTEETGREGDAKPLPTFAFTTGDSAITVPDGGVILRGGITRMTDGQSKTQLAAGSEEELVGGRLKLDPPSAEKSLEGRQNPTVLQEVHAGQNAFSTFSLNVSDVSFKLARTALAQGQWPDAANVRVEEFVNAFDYGDPLPGQDEKVACAMEQSIHPFLQQRNLLRVSMRTAATGRAANTPLRLTFVLDNSGSMERLDRQQTVRRAFRLMAEQLKPIDQATLITFARQPRLVADRVSGANAAPLVQMVENLPSEGGTNIEAALELAFAKAREQQLAGAQNRIILLTDGAVNLGNADPEGLARLIATIRDSGIAFDAAGICADGLNDELLEALTRYGDGRYYLLDSAEDADDGFARQLAGALQPSAMNVKVQVEFNPKRVGYYKLLGFEKHRLNTEDFRDDQVDAAEMTAAEAGVAMYQFEPKPDGVGDVGSVAVRFLDPATGQMVENRWPIPYQPEAPRPEQASPSLRVATSAALLAVKLRGEPLGEVVELQTLAGLLAGLPDPVRTVTRVQELEQMIEQARRIAEK